MRLALVGALVAAVAVANAGAVTDVVTLSVRHYVNANHVRVLVWYGQVSGSGGELVEVQARDCGTAGPFYTIAETAPPSAGATRSRANSPCLPMGSDGQRAQTYRAHWGDQLSEPSPGRGFLSSRGPKGCLAGGPGRCTSTTTAFR